MTWKMELLAGIKVKTFKYAYRHPLHKTWYGMLQRCYSPTDSYYHRYGGRGIKVCERWHSLENFIADMGAKPALAHIDRINNDGNYEPGNCRWASCKENQRNRADAVRLPDGRSVIEECNRLGYDAHLVRARIRKHGMASVLNEDGSLKDPKTHKRITKRVNPLSHPYCRVKWEMVDEIRGSTLTGQALAEKLGVSPSTVSLIRRGRMWEDWKRGLPLAA
jgi:hypothetical protein